MDVQGSPRGDGRPCDSRQAPPTPASGARALSAERVGEALGEWQAQELRLARGFAQCRGLAREQLEDLYQETALVLLERVYHSEEHLRSALRWGVKHRALHLHRDRRRRREILTRCAPELELAAQAREGEHTPELAALLEGDRLIVTEFFTELSDLERRVFWLLAEGMRYRAIAPVLEVPVNEVRRASRACERKRERFQLLYDTGRLCGFRSQTILALQAGEAVGEELAQRAFAHLQACVHCRTEHRTNARRLRHSFQSHAAALLPIPVLAGRLGWLSRLDFRTRALTQRLAPYGTPPTGGGVRERAAALLAAGGATAKLAAGVATVAVIAGGTIGATHALEHRPAHHHQHTPASATGASRPPTTALITATVAPSDQAPTHTGNERTPRPQPHPAEGHAPGQRREPGGFAYLGVPSGTPPQPSPPARATTATVSGGSGSGERAGGPFSP